RVHDWRPRFERRVPPRSRRRLSSRGHGRRSVRARRGRALHRRSHVDRGAGDRRARELAGRVQLKIRRRVAIGAGWIAGGLLAALFAASLPVVAVTVLNWYAPVDRPFETTDLSHARAVVVLGAGMDRVVEAARVYRLLDRPWLISSGGLETCRAAAPPAFRMRNAVVQRGVPGDRILLEAPSSTTRDQAVMVAPMLRRLDCRSFVLVTSRTHMRRALAAFRAEALDPVAAASRDEASVPPSS